MLSHIGGRNWNTGTLRPMPIHRREHTFGGDTPDRGAELRSALDRTWGAGNVAKAAMADMTDDEVTSNEQHVVEAVRALGESLEGGGVQLDVSSPTHGWRFTVGPDGVLERVEVKP